MSASYGVYILNDDGQRVALLDTRIMQPFRYERKLNDVGLVQFTMPADDSRASLITKHTLLDVCRYPDASTEEVEMSALVVVHNPVIDGGVEHLIVSAASLEYLLAQRVIDPRNDPAMAGGYSTKLLPADTLLAELVREQAGELAQAHGVTPSQAVPDLAVAPTAGVGEVVPIREAWSGLLKVMQQVTGGDRMDFRLVRTNGTAIRFYAERIGSDKTRSTNWPGNPFVILSPDLGTLRSPALVRDWRTEKTVVILLEKGAGDNRQFFGSMTSNHTETPYSVSVHVEDVREAETAAEIVEQARKALVKHRAKTELTFEANPQHYKALWDLGDFVTAQWRGLEYDMRIVGVTVEPNDSGEETITPLLRLKYEAGSES